MGKITFDVGSKDNVQLILKRMFMLAYQAAGSSFGMGMMQAREGATEDEVFDNVIGAGDYCGPAHHGQGRLYGDYVFGRMLKLTIEFNGTTITVKDEVEDISYCAWATKLDTQLKLFEIARISLDIDAVEK